MGLSAVTRGILGGRGSSCISLNEGKSQSEEPTLLGQCCFSSSSFASPSSCSTACPRTVPLGRDDPLELGTWGYPTRRCVPQQRGWGQSCWGQLAGLEGGGGCRRAAGRPGCVLVVHTQPFSCFPAPPHLASGLPWTEDTSFPTECVDGVHPMGSYTHFYCPLKCLLYWAFPVLKVFPKRLLSQEAPVNKLISEGAGGFVFISDLLFPHPPPNLRHAMCPKPHCPMGLWSRNTSWSNGKVLGGHQWLCWLICAGLLLQRAPVVQWEHGDNQLLSFSMSHVLKNCVRRRCSPCGLQGLPACSFLL